MNGWTESRKAQQSEAIHRWKPWQRSTGPRTPEGKARVARNAYRGGARATQRALARARTEEVRAMNEEFQRQLQLAHARARRIG
jgi:hypothetical protein